MKTIKVLGILAFCLGLWACTEKSDNGSESSANPAVTHSERKLSDEERAKLRDDFATTPFKVLHIAELSFDNAPAIAVRFSTPIDPKSEWRSYLSIRQQEGGALKGDWVLGDNLNTAFYPFVEADTTYEVQVKSGLEALTGRMLEAPWKTQVSTRSAEHMVKFISYGTQLSPQLSDGLSVESVNVEAIDIDFFRVRPSKMADFLYSNLGSYLYELENIQYYADLAYTARFDLNFAKNKRLKSVIPITDIKDLREPGVYFAVMKEAGKYGYEFQTTWFSVGDIGMQARSLGNDLYLFVHQVESAKPASGTQIKLFNSSSELIEESSTNSDGFAEFKGLSQGVSFAIAQKGEHFSVLKIAGPAMDLSEFKLPSRVQRAMELFIYSPRDLYRPGEQVQLNALLRDHDGKLAQASPIQATIYTPDHRAFQSFNWQGDESAFYEHSLRLPAQAMRGEWRLEARLGNGDLFEYPFSVEDFLPERMKLELQSADGKDQLANNEAVRVKVQGDYFYGAPAAGNRVEVSVTSKQARTLFEEWKDFIFGVEDFNRYDYNFDIDAFELDDKGAGEFSLPLSWENATSPIRVKSQVSLFESGGRPVSRSIEHTLWPSDALVGLRPTWDGNRALPNAQAVLELIRVNRKGELTAAEDLDVLAYREDEAYYWEWRNDWQYSSNRRDVPVFNRQLSIEEGQRGTVAVPVDYGNYRIEVRSKGNRELLASYRFFAGWSWDRPAAGETGRPDKIDMAWNADALMPGSSAELSITAPYDGTALISVESDRMLWHHQVAVKAGENSVSVPIDAAWNRHDIYATANVIRAGSAKTKALPKRAFGLIHLPLDRSDRSLALELSAPEKVLPETELTAVIQTDKKAGEEISLTLAAVDSGVLSISRFKTPDAHAWFFEKRAYNSELRDSWAWFIEQLGDKNARQRFGGDADEELARGGEAPQNEVQVVSLYSGKVVVGANGKAEIKLPLPYFNGELRLMGMAWSDQRFGQFEQKVKVAAPLVAEVSTPRFLALNDKSNASFDLQNMSDAAQTLEIIASADPSLGGKQVSLDVSLEPMQRHIFKLPLTASRSDGLGTVSISVEQQGQAANPVSLKREWRIGMRPAYPAKLEQTDVVVDPGQTYSYPDMRSQFELGTQALQLAASPRPPLNLNEHLEHLIQYPYGCLEQTTSRAVPLLLSSKADLLRYGADAEFVANRGDALTQAIGRISGMQRSDGSFGLWSNQANEVHWLSVYATEFLLQAKESGYTVNDGVLAAAMQRLSEYLDTQGRIWTEYDHYSEYPEHYHFAYRAYAALVLAQQQKASLGQVRELYDSHARHARTRLSMAHIALALELVGDARRAEQAWKIALGASEKPRGYTGDYHSDVRDLAWTTRLAMRSKIVEQPLKQLLNLRSELIDRRWLSTQDRSALFQLGKALDAGDVGEWQMTLNLGSGSEAISQSKDLLKTIKGEQIPSHISIANTFSKPLFVSLRHNGYPTSAPKAVADGLQVRRFFFNDKGQPIDLSKVQSGDLILVKLDVSSLREERVPDALVVDLLPAGFELENQNLDSAVKMDEMQIGGQSVADWRSNSQIVHEEYQDDRYVAAIQLYRNAASLIYLARAVTPGEYQIPPTLVEDMYRPWLRAIGKDDGSVRILAK